VQIKSLYVTLLVIYFKIIKKKHFLSRMSLWNIGFIEKKLCGANRFRQLRTTIGLEEAALGVLSLSS